MQQGTPPGALPPGTQLTVGSHKAVVKSYISEGGFAHVYVVEITPSDLEGNVACLKRVMVPDKVHLNLLRAEVEAMQRVKGHPNIVRYIDSHAKRSDTGSGYEVFVLMEYCSRHGLIDFMNTRLREQLTESEILKIMYDVTSGLACLHYLKPPLVHRDLKIENILISGDGTYKLCDFGSASPILRPPRNSTEFAILDEDIQRYTTAQYRAPEMVDIYKGFPIDEKSDIWALGVFLYKLCYYTTPFEREGQLAILNARYTFPPKPAYSDRLKRIIVATLQPDPRNRPNVYQVLKEVCSMRGVEVPIKDIYTHPTAGGYVEGVAVGTTPPPTTTLQVPHQQQQQQQQQQMISGGPNMTPVEPTSALVRSQPQAPKERPVPEVTPMYRGRPPKREVAASTGGLAPPPGAQGVPSRSPSKSPVFSDPFEMLDTGKNTPGGGGEPQRPATLDFDLDNYDVESRFPTIEELTRDLKLHSLDYSEPSQPAERTSAETSVAARKDAFEERLLIDTGSGQPSSAPVEGASPVSSVQRVETAPAASSRTPVDRFSPAVYPAAAAAPSAPTDKASPVSASVARFETPADNSSPTVSAQPEMQPDLEFALPRPVKRARPPATMAGSAVTPVQQVPQVQQAPQVQRSSRAPQIPQRPSTQSQSKANVPTKTIDLDAGRGVGMEPAAIAPAKPTATGPSPPPPAVKPQYLSDQSKKSMQAVQQALSGMDRDKPLPAPPRKPSDSSSARSSFEAERPGERSAPGRYGTVPRRPPPGEGVPRSRPRPVSMYSSRDHESDRYFGFDPAEEYRDEDNRRQPNVMDSIPVDDREQLQRILTGLSQHSNSDVLQRDNHIDSNVDFLKLLDHENTGRSRTSSRNHHRKPSRSSQFLAATGPGASGGPVGHPDDGQGPISRSASASSHRHSKRASMSSLKGLFIGDSTSKRPGAEASVPSSRSTSDSLAMPPPPTTRKLSGGTGPSDSISARTSLDSSRLRPSAASISTAAKRRSIVGRFSYSTDNLGEFAVADDLSGSGSSSGSGDSSTVEGDDSNSHHSHGLHSIKSRLKRHSSRSSSIHSRIQMLMNRKQSPPRRTAHGYGKYTDDGQPDEPEPRTSVSSAPAVVVTRPRADPWRKQQPQPPQTPTAQASPEPESATDKIRAGGDPSSQHHQRQLSTVSSASSTSSSGKRVPPRPQKPAHLQSPRGKKSAPDTFEVPLARQQLR